MPPPITARRKMIRTSWSRGAVPQPARPALNFSPALGPPEKRVVSKGFSGRPEDPGAPPKALSVLSLAVFSGS